jgi:hypothetical protein
VLTYASKNYKVSRTGYNSHKVISFHFDEAHSLVLHLRVYDFSYTTTECSCSILITCLNISKAACGWNAGYRYAVRIKLTSTERAPTYHFVTSLIYTSTRSVSEGNNHGADPNSRKRKIANILYRCYWCSVDGHIREWSIRKGLGSKPIHSQDGGVATQPIAA